MGAEADVMPYLISRFFPMDSFPEIYGYSFTAYAIAAAFGPLLMGWSFDQFHSCVIAALALAQAMLGRSRLDSFRHRTPKLSDCSKAARQNP